MATVKVLTRNYNTSDNSMVIGHSAEIAPGNTQCTAIGYGAKAMHGHYATAFGGQAKALYFGSTAIGQDSSAGKYSTAIGQNAQAEGHDDGGSVAIGRHSRAMPYSVVVGAGSYAMGESVAIGTNCCVYGYASIAIGSRATCTESSQISFKAGGIGVRCSMRDFVNMLKTYANGTEY